MLLSARGGSHDVIEDLLGFGLFGNLPPHTALACVSEFVHTSYFEPLLGQGVIPTRRRMILRSTMLGTLTSL